MLLPSTSRLAALALVLASSVGSGSSIASDAAPPSALRPGDHVEFIVDDKKANWTGERVYVAGCSGSCSRLGFFAGYTCQRGCVVGSVRDGFFTVTDWDSLYAPESAARRK